jgi:UDP-N-acetylmuramate: L-alanyl-gamma-D-glutamyl-meso-diaminopimelate ligase
MRVHFIAIGGSAMHNLALALHEKGYIVTGSDDEINEPSKSRLEAKGLLPAEIGWFPSKLNTGIDAVILGMHARIDNPELAQAKELGLKVYSYPEYLYEATKNKTRIVIGGSHGKTSITSMILHVFKQLNIETDYMVGAQLEGFDTMVKLTHSAKYAIFEGDEYLSSPIDRRPKFHLYQPNIALLSGIAWDHINVFPTFENYIEQFEIFIQKISHGGTLIYCKNDEVLNRISHEAREDIKSMGYGIPAHEITDGITYLLHDGLKTEIKVFGNHNLMNLNGARLVCNEVGISEQDFYGAIQSFKGAAKRLELIAKNESTFIFKDFAHSPSKLKATTDAVKQQFPNKKLIACMELHTFSSLNINFLNEYKGCMSLADEAFVYFNPHTIEHKKLENISEQQVAEAFGGSNITVFTNSDVLVSKLQSLDLNNAVLLLMSSGNFDGIDLNNFAVELLKG